MISFSVYSENMDVYLNKISDELFNSEYLFKFHFSKSFHLQPFVKLYFHDKQLNNDNSTVEWLFSLLHNSIQGGELSSFYDDLFLSRKKEEVFKNEIAGFDEVDYGGEVLLPQILEVLNCASIVIIQNLEGKEIDLIERIAICLQLQFALLLSFGITIEDIHEKYSSQYNQLYNSSKLWVKKEDIELIEEKYNASKEAIVDYINSLYSFFDPINGDSYPIPNWVGNCRNLKFGLEEAFKNRSLNFRGNYNYFHTEDGFNERIEFVINKLLKEITHMSGVVTVLDELECLYFLKEGIRPLKSIC